MKATEHAWYIAQYFPVVLFIMLYTVSCLNLSAPRMWDLQDHLQETRKADAAISSPLPPQYSPHSLAGHGPRHWSFGESRTPKRHHHHAQVSDSLGRARFPNARLEDPQADLLRWAEAWQALRWLSEKTLQGHSESVFQRLSYWHQQLGALSYRPGWLERTHR